jgi:two-component system chemotaxis response regulator CheY
MFSKTCIGRAIENLSFDASRIPLRRRKPGFRPKENLPKDNFLLADITTIYRCLSARIARRKILSAAHECKELKMKILVVDDSTAMRLMVVRTLRQAGFGGKDVEQAADGVEALDAIQKNMPDLVLADWNMPNMTGIELLEALRSNDIDVTFGFITTESTTEMRQRATDAGAQFLIAKPFTAESFEKVLSTIVK